MVFWGWKSKLCLWLVLESHWWRFFVLSCLAGVDARFFYICQFWGCVGGILGPSPLASGLEVIICKSLVYPRFNGISGELNSEPWTLTLKSEQIAVSTMWSMFGQFFQNNTHEVLLCKLVIHTRLHRWIELELWIPNPERLGSQISLSISEPSTLILCALVGLLQLWWAHWLVVYYCWTGETNRFSSHSLQNWWYALWKRTELYNLFP